MLSSPDWKLTLVTNHKVPMQCPTTKYPCSAQPLSIPAVPNRRVSLQCPTTKYPCSAQPKSISAVPNRRVSLECPTAESQFSCSAFAVLQGRQLRRGRETLHFLCNYGFSLRMLEVHLFFHFQPPKRSTRDLKTTRPFGNLLWGHGKLGVSFLALFSESA